VKQDLFKYARLQKDRSRGVACHARNALRREPERQLPYKPLVD